jgi:hypothetical protein
MRRARWQAWGAAILLLAGGCATGPLQENPVLIHPTSVAGIANPVYLPYGPTSYGMVFEHVLDVVDDYFEIAYSNRYDGRIETFPRIAPGLGQPWKPGSPDCYQRLLASFQTIRHRAIVVILPTHEGGGGYKVDVKVYKELEDLERPIRATYGSAIFRADNQIERQYEVVDPAVFESTWIPIGRDEKLEQVLLERIAHMNPPATPQSWGGWCRQLCTGLVRSPAPPPPAPLPPQTPPRPATLPPGNP